MGANRYAMLSAGLRVRVESLQDLGWRAAFVGTNVTPKYRLLCPNVNLCPGLTWTRRLCDFDSDGLFSVALIVARKYSFIWTRILVLHNLTLAMAKMGLSIGSLEA